MAPEAKVFKRKPWDCFTAHWGWGAGWSGGGGGRCLLTLPLLGPLKPARLARAPRSRNRREEKAMMEEALLPSRSSFHRTSERGKGGRGCSFESQVRGTFPGSPGLTPSIHAWMRNPRSASGSQTPGGGPQEGLSSPASRPRRWEGSFWTTLETQFFRCEHGVPRRLGASYRKFTFANCSGRGRESRVGSRICFLAFCPGSRKRSKQ